MKRIVSISLGSSRRDHLAKVKLLGEQVLIERLGTDGDLQKAIQMVRNLDGTIDAFGMGGIDRYLFAGSQRYEVRDAAKIAAAAKKTPIVDGSGLKNTLERRVVTFLKKKLPVKLQEQKVLMVSAVDRFGMAEAFDEMGCRMIFGDLIFALGVPLPLRSITGLRRTAHLLLPVVTRLPFQMLYPTGSKQDESVPKYQKYYQEADIIAGDFLYINKCLPESLAKKIIVTNTITDSDVQNLQKRGVAYLVTSTPDLEGRSFGTNVIEALVVAFSGKRPDELGEGDYLKLMGELEIGPRLEKLN